MSFTYVQHKVSYAKHEVSHYPYLDHCTGFDWVIHASRCDWVFDLCRLIWPVRTSWLCEIIKNIEMEFDWFHLVGNSDGTQLLWGSIGEHWIFILPHNLWKEAILKSQVSRLLPRVQYPRTLMHLKFEMLRSGYGVLKKFLENTNLEIKTFLSVEEIKNKLGKSIFKHMCAETIHIPTERKRRYTFITPRLVKVM